MKTKSVLLLAAISLLLSAHFSVKPPHTIHGIVSDDNGDPLIGASVLVKGTTLGTVTDLEGRFSLTTQDSCATLVVGADVVVDDGGAALVELVDGAAVVVVLAVVVGSSISTVSGGRVAGGEVSNV